MITESLKSLVKTVLPRGLQRQIRCGLDYFPRRRIIRALEELPSDDETEEVLRFMRQHGKIYVFPYDFALDAAKEALEKNIQVYEDNGHPYVLHKGHRMYGKCGCDSAWLRSYYAELLIEQHPASPHCYFRDNRCPGSEDVVADVGAAEGIFTLDIIDQVKKAYLFECDPDWTAALEKTLEPFGDKVELVKKYVGDKTGGNSIALDDFFAGKDITYLKADIEGAEESAILGGSKIVFPKKLRRVLLCTYHRKDDETRLAAMLANLGYKTILNPGYMLFFYAADFGPPYIRRGVLYGERSNPTV